MRIEYLGHSSFLFEGSGVTLVTDPYDPTVGYGASTRHADFALVSHDHWDHNHVAGLHGKCRVVTGSGVKELTPTITVRGVLAEHDAVRGAQFGLVNLYAWAMDSVRVVFLSDLGHVLRPDQVSELGPADVLLVPVGGHYTVDGPTAQTVVRQFPDARLVIPMHYCTPALNREQFPIAGVEPFLHGYDRIRQERGGAITVDKSKLPSQMEIVVMTSVF